MKKIITLMVCLCALFGASAQVPASSNTPEYQAELNKVLAVQNSREMSVNTFKQAFSSLTKQGLLPQDKVDAMAVELTEALYPRIEAQIKQIYMETFTLDDLKKIEKWVTSPVGKKLIELTPKTAAISQELMSQPEVQNEIMTIVSKYMKK